MKPKTKREAERVLETLGELEQRAATWARFSERSGSRRAAKNRREEERSYRAEAARLRALLPTLPE